MEFPKFFYQYEWTDNFDYSADVSIKYHDVEDQDGKTLVQDFHIPESKIDKWSYDDIHEFLRAFVPKAKSWEDIQMIADHLELRWS